MLSIASRALLERSANVTEAKRFWPRGCGEEQDIALALVDSMLEGLKLIAVLEIASTCTCREKIKGTSMDLCASEGWRSNQLGKRLLSRMPFLSFPEIITTCGLAYLS